MNKDSKIFVSGHRGLIGSAIVRKLRAEGYRDIYTVGREGEFGVDLCNAAVVEWWFSCFKPEYVFHCAARVGGLQANRNNPLAFFLENMQMEMNVIGMAAKYDVKKLMFLGSSCVYPTTAPKPLLEKSLLTGPFEPAVEAYGLAKVSGVRLCQWYRQERGHNFISVLPCNTFGLNDRLDVATSHVVPGLLRRLYEGKSQEEPVKIWGDGTATRELLFSDDLADALVLVMNRYNQSEPINTGSGQEMTIRGLAEACAQVVGYEKPLVFDPAAPVGTQHKCMDNSKLFALGWRPKTPLIDALRVSYADMVRRLDIPGNN